MSPKQQVWLAWWKPPARGIPADHCPVPFYDLQAVPGMEPWLLVHLLRPMVRAKLPEGMVPTRELVGLLDGGETDGDEPAVVYPPAPEEEETLESDLKPRMAW
jgi:hypothetical protein